MSFGIDRVHTIWAHLRIDGHPVRMYRQREREGKGHASDRRSQKVSEH